MEISKSLIGKNIVDKKNWIKRAVLCISCESEWEKVSVMDMIKAPIEVRKEKVNRVNTQIVVNFY
jgi:hypothetical protein